MATEASLTGSWLYSHDVYPPPLPNLLGVSLTLQQSGTQLTGSGSGGLARYPDGGFTIEDIQGTVTGSAVSLNAQIRSESGGGPGKDTSPATFTGTWDGADSISGTWSGAISGSAPMGRWITGPHGKPTP